MNNETKKKKKKKKKNKKKTHNGPIKKKKLSQHLVEYQFFEKKNPISYHLGYNYNVNFSNVISGKHYVHIFLVP